MTDNETVFLTHVTTRKAAESIVANGMLGGSYWAEDGHLAAYYRAVVREENEDGDPENDPVEIVLPLSVLEGCSPKPDFPGLEEAITVALGKSQDEIDEEWESLRKIGTGRRAWKSYRPSSALTRSPLNSSSSTILIWCQTGTRRCYVNKRSGPHEKIGQRKGALQPCGCAPPFRHCGADE